MSSKPTNVAVIGYGLSAKVFHIPLILSIPSYKLHGIVQRHPKPEDDAEKDHSGVIGYRSVEEMVKDASVDLVIVTTIPETHVELTKLALNAGKHVVVEKPFTPTALEADELISLAKEKGRLITVYQNRRWDSDFLTLSALIKQGTLGRIVEFETHFDRHRPGQPPATWKAKPVPSSGAIYDLGTHLIDQVIHTFGIPKRVTGFVGSQRANAPEGTEDSCTVLLHYKDGMMATVKAGVVSCEVEQLRYWIRGEKGSFKKFHLDCQEDQLRSGMKPTDSGFAVEPESNYGNLTTMHGDTPRRDILPTVKPATYLEYYHILSRALAGEGDVPVKAEDARDLIQLIELARESSRLGKTLDVSNHA